LFFLFEHVNHRELQIEKFSKWKNLSLFKSFCKFSESYNKCKTTSAKLSTLHTFGKNSNPVAPLIKKGKNLQGSKLINVQPTAIARRKIHLGGRHMQQSGRPPKRAGAYDHNYANETGKKRIKSAPHSISICVENNISLAK
jgi:hypothetical protein